MAKFLSGNALNAEIENIIEGAEKLIVLISPYIKLHEKYSSALQAKRSNPEIKLIVVFGKNEDDISKSMIAEDFNFFKSFPNVNIYYEKRLHAKYIANERASIVTSMNFHKYSQDNNIEVGVKSEQGSFFENKIGGGDSHFEEEAWEYFQRVIDQAELVYKKEPVIETKLFGLSKNYKDSKVIDDKLSVFFENKNIVAPKSSVKSALASGGYCIRTGKQIPFNIKKPLCDEAYASWIKDSNRDLPETYCHFSGEPSKGETSFSKPVLRKNYKQAKEHEKSSK